jgi:hypothetical protein
MARLWQGKRVFTVRAICWKQLMCKYLNGAPFSTEQQPLQKSCNTTAVVWWPSTRDCSKRKLAATHEGLHGGKARRNYSTQQLTWLSCLLGLTCRLMLSPSSTVLLAAAAEGAAR